jgi:hypothetical protein
MNNIDAPIHGRHRLHHKIRCETADLDSDSDIAHDQGKSTHAQEYAEV